MAVELGRRAEAQSSKPSGLHPKFSSGRIFVLLSHGWRKLLLAELGSRLVPARSLMNEYLHRAFSMIWTIHDHVRNVLGLPRPQLSTFSVDLVDSLDGTESLLLVPSLFLTHFFPEISFIRLHHSGYRSVFRYTA